MRIISLVLGPAGCDDRFLTDVEIVLNSLLPELAPDPLDDPVLAEEPVAVGRSLPRLVGDMGGTWVIWGMGGALISWGNGSDVWIGGGIACVLPPACCFRLLPDDLSRRGGVEVMFRNGSNGTDVGTGDGRL